MPKVWSITNQRGFSVVEALLAATVFGMVATAVIGAFVYGRGATANAGNRERANMLAEEGLEAARNIRDGAGYGALADGTYGLAKVAGTWALSGSSDTNDIYIRQVTVASDGANRKKITSTVTWNQGFGTVQTAVTSQLANWSAAIKSWLNATNVGSLDASGTVDGWKIATAGNYAYMVRNASVTPNFLVVNISNPAAPTLTGSLTLPNGPTGVAISGNYAYVSSTVDTAELRVINIANPAAPALLSSLDLSGISNATAIAVSGNYAYIVRTSSTAAEFAVVNISNPAAPTYVGGIAPQIGMLSVVVNGNYAYVGTGSTTQGLLVINIATPSAPVLSKSYSLQSTTPVLSLAIAGTALFIGQSTTLSILNVTDPLNATRTATLTTTGSGAVNSIALDPAGTYAFLGTSYTSGEFQIVNVSNLASPSVAKTIDIAGTASNLYGVAYNTSLDVVAGASAADTKEIVVFTRN